ncbi:unnamed protein product [Ectocarpus sp. CCAP 1310/34]|nr:unnamed protein product [Ectocarpus sp. CCAP 1310/34]
MTVSIVRHGGQWCDGKNVAAKWKCNL